MAEVGEQTNPSGAVENGNAPAAGDAPASSDPSVSMVDIQAGGGGDDGDPEVSSSAPGAGGSAAGSGGSTLPPPPDHPGPKISGVCKWFDPTKGFGFITPADGGDDVFVHQSSLYANGYRSLAEGEEVLFAIETSDDGRNKAVAVTGPDGGVVQGAARRRHGGYHRADYREAGGVARGGRGGAGGPGGYGPGGYSRGSGRGRMGPGRGMGPAPVLGPNGEAGEESSGFQIVVHNLPWKTTWQDLKDHFSTAGTVGGRRERGGGGGMDEHCRGRGDLL